MIHRALLFIFLFLFLAFFSFAQCDVTVSVVNPYCSNYGSITSVSNTATNYVYVWSNGETTASTASSTIDSLTAGTYSVTITDNASCTTTESYTLYNLANPPINSYYLDALGQKVYTSVICDGRPLIIETISQLNCPNCVYQWSDGTTSYNTFAFNANTYSVTITDNSPNGCTGISSNYNVTASNLAVPQLQRDSFSICVYPDQLTSTYPTLSVTNICTGCDYQWYTSDGIPVAGEDSSSFTLDITNGPGEYYVQAMDDSTCYENSAIYIINNTTVTPPSLSSSGTTICDSNSITISTYDCPGCEFQWAFYDYDPRDKLIISGVFDGTRPGAHPRGLELYAIGSIPDLSAYKLSFSQNTNNLPITPPANADTYQFPSVSLTSGDFIYVTNDSSVEFSAFFGRMPDFIYPNMTNQFNGAGGDSIALYYNNSIIDKYSRLDFENSWSVRKDNNLPNFTYTDSEWLHGETNPDAFDVTNRVNEFWGIDSFPIKNFSTDTMDPLQAIMITGVMADTLNGFIKGVQLLINQNITDLSTYRLGFVNDGIGSAEDAVVFNLPPVEVKAGTYYYVTNDLVDFNAFFGFGADFASVVLDSLDGKDAILLLKNECYYDKTIELPIVNWYNYGAVDFPITRSPQYYYGSSIDPILKYHFIFDDAKEATTDGANLSVSASGDLNRDYYIYFNGFYFYFYIYNEWFYIADEDRPFYSFYNLLGNDGGQCNSNILNYELTNSILTKPKIDGMLDANAFNYAISPFGDYLNYPFYTQVNLNYDSTIVFEAYPTRWVNECGSSSNLNFISMNLQYDCVDNDAYIVVDRYGNLNNSGSASHHQMGWAKSDIGRKASPDFNVNDWNINSNYFIGCAINTSCPNRFIIDNNFQGDVYYSNLMISGLFDADPAGDHPRGIELYTLTEINVQSQIDVYKIRITKDDGTIDSFQINGADPSLTYPIPAGSFIYLTENATQFTDFFGFSSNVIENTKCNVLDGNDYIELRYEFGSVDEFLADEFGVSPPVLNYKDWTWCYEDGWAYRNNNTFPDVNFDSTVSWKFNKYGYRPYNSLFGTDSMPVRTFNYDFAGDVQFLLISESDSSVFSTDLVGDYSVLVTYPDGCVAESDTFRIDTLVFEPEIYAYMPLNKNLNNSSMDTSYLCFGSIVEMCMMQPYELPPNWSYQWEKEGIPLAGANGFCYNANTPGRYRVLVTQESGCQSYSNTIYVIASSNGSNPNVATTSEYLCDSTFVATLSTLSCEDCSYQWFVDNAGTAVQGQESSLDVTDLKIGGYYVKVTDEISGCRYVSDILVIKDTTYPAPTLLSSGNPVCSDDPLLLTSSIVCAGCSYTYVIDYFNDSLYTDTVLLTPQYNIQVNAAGSYSLFVQQNNGCISEQSNIVQATFNTINAFILSDGVSNICNGSPMTLSSLPDSIEDCSGCTYTFLQNGFPMQAQAISYEQEISVPGTYAVVISNSENCADTSSSIVVDEINIDASINASTTKICGPTDTVFLSVDSCDGCSYSWQYREQVSDTGGCDYSIVLIDSSASGAWYTGAAPSSEINIFDGFSAANYSFFSGADSTFQITVPRDSTFYVADLINSGLPDLNFEVYFQNEMVFDRQDVKDTFLLVCPGVPIIPPRVNFTDNDTIFSFFGYGTDGVYFSTIENGGCVVSDSVSIDSIQELTVFIELDSNVSMNPVICDGSSVVLYDTCEACILSDQYTFQWYLNGSPVAGASFESIELNAPGDYELYIIDTNNCRTFSNSIMVDEFSSPLDFDLDFSGIIPVPLTLGNLNMNDYLYPSGLTTNPTGVYTSQTAGPYIADSLLNVTGAGSGLHYITFTFSESSSIGTCEFSVVDTLEVMGDININITNINPAAPLNEACLGDTLSVELEFFTFIPTQVLFNAGGGNTISVPINASFLDSITGLTTVYEMNFNVIVPAGARTGKLTLTDGTNDFLSPNFFVVHNPAVTINLESTTAPICSDLDSVIFSGEPAGGYFSAHYFGLTNSSNPELMNNDTLELDSLSGFGGNPYQDLVMTYYYTPGYTGNPGSCPQITDSLIVEVRDVELDSVQYTPVAYSQASESLFDLTRVIYPITSRNYTGGYTGTYAIANNLLVNTTDTILGQITYDTITYEIVNDVCSNASTDLVTVWPAPGLLDSLPNYLCSLNDTVIIMRNADSLMMYYKNQLIYADTLYDYDLITTFYPNATDVELYMIEEYGLMTVNSTNGGLTVVDNTKGAEIIHFIPANVSGTSTVLSFEFEYRREEYYTTGVVTADTILYTVSEISKNIIIESPPNVQISPVIMADTVFCPINEETLLLSIPVGGIHYLNGDTVLGNAADPSTVNIFNPTNYTSGQSYTLTYVYEGFACVDSASTGVYLSTPFNIELVPDNGSGDYCENSPDDTVRFNLLTAGYDPALIDSAASQLFVGGLLTGVVFSPTNLSASALEVQYIVYDTFGCPAEDFDTFTINPIPVLGMTTVDPIQCANADTTRLILTYNGTQITYQPYIYPVGHSSLVYGDGIVAGGSNSTDPYFYPTGAGAGTANFTFIYEDSIGCIDSLNQSIELIALPDVSLTLANGDTIPRYLCENDRLTVVGSPLGSQFSSGYGSDTDPFTGAPFPAGVIQSFDSSTLTLKPSNLTIPNPFPGIVEEVLFYWYEDMNGCRDSARASVLIRNFTTNPVFDVFPPGGADTICAQDMEYPVNIIDVMGGLAIDSSNNGFFSSNYPSAFLYQDPGTSGTVFYPDSGGFDIGSRYITLTYNYTDTATFISDTLGFGVCHNTHSDSVWVNVLPKLDLSEVSGTLNPPGSQTLVPNDTNNYYHFCQSALDIPILAYNTTGFFDPNTGITAGIVVDHISSDTGDYVLGNGIESYTYVVGTDTLIAYTYSPSLAGPGLDTIRYVYTDALGCTDSVDYYIMIDSIPELGFAGLTNPINSTGSTDTFAFCETDPVPPQILPYPLGVSWSLNFGGNPINSIPMQLRPDTLAVSGTYMYYPIRFDYIGQIYTDPIHPPCKDSITSMIEIRPAPVLNWVDIPDKFCLEEDSMLLPISATPYGGALSDQTFGVLTGIVDDSLFVPYVQPGKRKLVYYYMNDTSQCSDTIQHNIYVYTKPKINFDISGGCAGKEIDFIASTAPYGLEYNSVAIDSITRVIWDYGDGIADTLTNLPDTFVIPNGNHTYNSFGVFYPKLIVSNQNECDTTFIKRIVISPLVQPTDTMPYVEYFDDTHGNWYQEEADTTSVDLNVIDSLWQWGLAAGQNITTLNTSNGVWGTRLMVPNQTTYGQGENAWVYSPCFDLTELDRPMIRMSIWRNMLSNVDGAVLQYFDKMSNTWKVLGQNNKGINWYQDGFVVSSPGFQIGTPTGWTGSSFGWEDTRYRLDNIGQDLRLRDDVRFRVAFASDPSTLLNAYDGMVFDSVMVGNRTRNVLLEHFSGTGYKVPSGPTIEQIEDDLYHTVYNNLYGRDVSLIQFHTNYNSLNAFFTFNQTENLNRVYYYGISDDNQCRVDGKSLNYTTSNTSDLLNYPELEILDIESLEDPKFEMGFIGNFAVTTNNNTLTSKIYFKALEDLPAANYALHVAITEDSLLTLTNHRTMAVMRDMIQYSYNNRAWVKEDADTVEISWPINPQVHPNPNRLKLTAFLQNIASQEVYQVIGSRDLNIFNGSVDTLDVNVEEPLETTIFDMVLFPNPTEDAFRVQFSTALKSAHDWQLFDALGRELQSGSVQEGTENIDVNTAMLSSGMYIFAIRNDAVYAQRKVVVRRQ